MTNETTRTTALSIDAMRVAQTIAADEALGYTPAQLADRFAAEGVTSVALVVTDHDGVERCVYAHHAGPAPTYEHEVAGRDVAGKVLRRVQPAGGCGPCHRAVRGS